MLPEQTSNWQKLKRLKRSQWVVIVQSPFVLLLTWVRLRRGGYQETLARIKPFYSSDMSPQEQAKIAREVAFALAVAVKTGPWKPLCLLRSLALGWLLAKRGISFDIRIGVPYGKAKTQVGEAVSFSAHAWVEHAGIVLNDRQDIAENFSAFEKGSES